MDRLSKRESEIMEGVLEGLAAKEIGAKEYIATGTVQTHLKNIKRKLRARNTAQLVVRYLSTLEDPTTYLKQFCIAFFFLGIQGYMIASTAQIDMRPVRTQSRISRTKTRD